MAIAIVISSDSSDIRLLKTCRSLLKLGHTVHLIGWNRRPDLGVSCPIDGIKMHILSHKVRRRRSTIFGQACFTRHVLKSLLGIRPATVIAVNEDNLIRCLPLYGIAYSRLVCDLYDSHRDRLSDQIFPINKIASAVCHYAHARADAVIATDENRRGTLSVSRSRSVVIGNYPEDPGDSLSRNTVHGPPKLFVGGTLAKRRGLDVLVEALPYVPQLRVIAAGWFADDFSECKFCNHPQVSYIGHLTPSQSLVEASKCDAVLAMYAPDCRNHILASPNKAYDAVSIGRPLIINEEALLSRWIRDASLGHTTPYNDPRSLARVLDLLLLQRHELPRFAEYARTVFRSGYSWESTDTTFEALYGTAASA